MFNYPKGSGISGLMGFRSVTPGSDLYQYNCDVYGWDLNQSMAIIDRSGPQGRPKSRLGDPVNRLHVKGQVQTSAFPYPLLPKYAVGTVTVTQQMNVTSTGNTTTCAIALSGRFHDMEWSASNSKSGPNAPSQSDMWNMEAGFIADGTATISWNNNQVTISAATQNFAQTDVGTSWTYDPNYLQTKALTRVDAEGITDANSANVAAMVTYIASLAGPPEPNLKVVTSTFHRTDSAGGNFIIGWGLNDTDDFVTNPPTSSVRASQHPYTDATAVVVDAGTTSCAEQANVLWGLFQSVPYAYDVTVRPLTDIKRLATYRFINPGIQWRGTGKPGPQQVPYTVQSGNIYVYLSSNYAYGTGNRLVQASYTNDIAFGREILDYSLTRSITGTVLPRQYPQGIGGQSLPYYYTTNNAAFEGNASGTTLYTAVTFQFRSGLSGVVTFFADYRFHHDSDGIVLGVNQINFNQPTIINSTISATGWVLAAALGPPFSNLYFPASMSFAAFEA